MDFIAQYTSAKALFIYRLNCKKSQFHFSVSEILLKYVFK